MPVSKSLYKSYTGGQEVRRSQMAEQSMQQDAFNEVAQAEQERKARTGVGYRQSGKTRMEDKERALAAMANPEQLGQLYPAFAKVSKRVPMAEEMATRAFNQENNKHFMRQKAEDMRQKGDLQTARRYMDYASEMERKQKDMQKFSMDNTASELDEDAVIISNIRDPSSYMFAKHMSALRGRPLDLPDAYTEETGELLQGRMIDIENARERLGLQRMVVDDEEKFISGKKDFEQGKVEKGVLRSDMAKIQEKILDESREAKKYTLQPGASEALVDLAKTNPEEAFKIQAEGIAAKEKIQLESQVDPDVVAQKMELVDDLEAEILGFDESSAKLAGPGHRLRSLLKDAGYKGANLERLRAALPDIPFIGTTEDEEKKFLRADNKRDQLMSMLMPIYRTPGTGAVSDKDMALLMSRLPDPAVDDAESVKKKMVRIRRIISTGKKE